MSRTYLRGDLYYADLGHGIGLEQKGTRPVVIIQNNVGNKYSPTVIIAAITSKANIKAKLPTHYYLDAGNGLTQPSLVLMDPYKQIVDEWLEEAPYSALRILEKLREMGFEGGYSIVKAYVSSRKMDLNEKATVRFETMPGKQGQMDWGFFEDHLVYEDGKWKKLYCFLMILGYSRMRYIEFVTDMTQI